MVATEICEEFLLHPRNLAHVRKRRLSSEDARHLAELFKILGDPTRVRILQALLWKKLCVCDISALLEISVSAVSHQLRLLRSARLVRSERRGKYIFYALDDSHVATLFEEGRRHVEHG
ncbi:MAG: transcriptional regulator [Candidatus Hydrogenedentota bacterium]|nr:MAG: transcriptional regulator [Candidatus Hydrogenedentota bacterium]